MTTLVRVSELKKNYQTGEVNFEALRGISLEIAAGDFVAVMGQSGSGKSTLLHIIGGLDQSSSGWVQVGEHRLDKMNQTDLAVFRRDQVGFVFQFFHLVENLNVQANVELPALLSSTKSKKEIRRHSTELLERLGIADQAHKHPWNYPADSNRELPSPAPLLIPRGFYWLTNQPATSTVPAATRSWIFWANSIVRDKPF